MIDGGHSLLTGQVNITLGGTVLGLIAQSAAEDRQGGGHTVAFEIEIFKMCTELAGQDLVVDLSPAAVMTGSYNIMVKRNIDVAYQLIAVGGHLAEITVHSTTVEGDELRVIAVFWRGIDDEGNRKIVSIFIPARGFCPVDLGPVGENETVLQAQARTGE